MASDLISVNVASELPVALQRFLQFEQRNMWRTESFHDTEAGGNSDRQYLPECCSAFRLPRFWVPRRHFYVYGAWLECRARMCLSDEGGPDDYLAFPVHPGELAAYGAFLARAGAQEDTKNLRQLIAAPTSSTRTVLTWPDGEPERVSFAKLSLQSSAIGDRRLTRNRVALSVGLSHLVGRSGGDLPREIRWFLEPAGLMPRSLTRGGIIFRTIPQEVREGGVVPVPLFALMGGSTGNPPVFRQLIERTPVQARVVLEEVMLANFARLWVDLVFDFGLILEAHAQDLLLAMSGDLVPLGYFYYRDFEGLTVDWALRKARGLPEEGPLPHASEWFSTYETWGYKLYQLASVKMWISLYDYLHMVLRELESALLQWQADGVVMVDKVRKGELTFLFSQQLRQAIRKKVGMSEGEQYDIHDQLSRFVKFLMQVRREVVAAHI